MAPLISTLRVTVVSASSAGASAGASASVVSSTTSSGAAGASVDSSSVASVSVVVSSVSGVVASVDVVSSAVSSVVTSSVPVAASVPVASSVPVPSVSIVSVTTGLSPARPSAMPSAIAWTLEDCITMAMVRTATSATFHLFIVWRRVALWPSRLSLIQTTIPSCLGRRPTTPACLHVVRGQRAPTAHFGVTVTQKAVGGIFLFCLLNSTLRAF